MSSHKLDIVEVDFFKKFNMKLLKDILLLFLLIFSNIISAETIVPNSDHEQILQILKERKEKFSVYTQSLDDATGIFGLKSKKDLKNSQKYLVEIVRLDNKLIDVLNRRVDFKGFETINSNYKQLEAERKVGELLDALKLTDSRINQQNLKIEELKSIVRSRTLLSVFFGLFLLMQLIKIYRKHNFSRK